VKRNLIATIVIGGFVLLITFSSCCIDIMKAANDGYGVLLYKGSGLFFDESSKVIGNGHVSLRDSFGDRAANSNGWMKGTGSIDLESLRSMNRMGRMVDIIKKSELTWEGGQLKNKAFLETPLFKRGSGASVRVRFNVSKALESDIGTALSYNCFDNALSYNTSTQSEGIWAIKTVQGRSKSDQWYSGSFDIEKSIELNDTA
jgi:hypothetical protein